jgi:hypothetical protein
LAQLTASTKGADGVWGVLDAQANPSPVRNATFVNIAYRLGRCLAFDFDGFVSRSITLLSEQLCAVEMERREL